jgi:hypothetical protein
MAKKKGLFVIVTDFGRTSQRSFGGDSDILFASGKRRNQYEHFQWTIIDELDESVEESTRKNIRDKYEALGWDVVEATYLISPPSYRP